MNLMIVITKIKKLFWKNIIKGRKSCFNFKTAANEGDSKCFIFPTDSKKKKDTLQIIYIIKKEEFSGSRYRDIRQNEIKEYSLVEQSGDDKIQNIEAEIIDLNNEEIQILKKENICSYYLYGSLLTNYMGKSKDSVKIDCFNTQACFLMPNFTYLAKDDILIYFLKHK